MRVRLEIFFLTFLLLCQTWWSFGQEGNNNYKTYPGAKMIKLPQPNYQGITLEEAIKKRRSVRSYSKKALTLPQVSQLLFAAQGITGSIYGHELRAAPSAGALYPISSVRLKF